jgi:hypothetical protein
LSESKELQQLQDRRTGLVEQSCSLTKQRENLEEKVKMLEEKIAIADLENNNKAKLEAITQLESKVNGLEQKLKETLEEPRSLESEGETKSEIVEPQEPTEEMASQTSQAAEEEQEDEVVEVKAIEDPIIAEQEEFAEGLKKENERKKRRFF